ncbi:heat shock transcription factor, Y-linked-like [Sus scrofa]|uniref:HSF-type DNA-binding domain-containing protein n=1 Tax=Sus scrofa TaxID=9823 RepID=A0A5G2QBA9_PIG|nr:heat shock transcription factor, Y-linked-like [Sus scrofa]
MANAPSEIQGVSPKDESTGSESSITSPWCENSIIVDLDLRSQIEEKAFQALSEGSLMKEPCHTLCASEPDGDNDFPPLPFPRKLWEIVESDRFKSIWWDENGTSIVINEERFKKEVLERKAPFRIFETESMKSLVRQLSLYGFTKLRRNFQRPASLANILAEDNEVSAWNKLQFYHNPNFKRGCPHLLVRMKRRVRVKNASPVSASLLQGCSKKRSRTGGNVDNHNSDVAAETRGEDAFSASTNLNVPLIRWPYMSQRISNTTTPTRSGLSSPSSPSFRPPGQIVMAQHAIFSQLTTFHMHSQSSYSPASGHIVNFITTTTSISQYRCISYFPSGYFGLRVEPSPLPTRYQNISPTEGPLSNPQPAAHPWFPMPVATDTSAASLSRPNPQSSSVSEHHPNYH